MADSMSNRIRNLWVCRICVSTEKVNTQSKIECTLSPAKYYVKKKYYLNSHKEDEFLFAAASYESFTPGISPEPPFPTKPRDENNIAGLRCNRGFIEYVYVREGSRSCGIAKVLSTLCMLEPQLHSARQHISNLFVTKENKVLTQLKRYDREVALFQRCDKLIGLQNMPEETAVSFAYLSAAHLAGYKYLVVHRFDRLKDDCDGDFLKFKVNDIRRNKWLDEETGLISDIEGTGYSSYWYFCRR